MLRLELDIQDAGQYMPADSGRAESADHGWGPAFVLNHGRFRKRPAAACRPLLPRIPRLDASCSTCRLDCTNPQGLEDSGSYEMVAWRSG